MQRDCHTQLTIRRVFLADVWLTESPENRDFRFRKGHLYPMFERDPFCNWHAESPELQERHLPEAWGPCTVQCLPGEAGRPFYLFSPISIHGEGKTLCHQ